MTTKKPSVPVRVGQVWIDADSRGTGRRVRIVALEPSRAVVEGVVARRRSRVLYDDRGLRGYRLASEAPAAGA